MKGDATPTVQEQSLIRTKDIIQLIDKFILNSTTVKYSDPVICAPFRKFGLYVRIDSTGAPTTIQVKVEFLEKHGGEWYQYKQGLFSSLFWEDTDTASGILEAFVGDVLGREMRVTLTAVGPSSTKYFQTSIAVDFWN